MAAQTQDKFQKKGASTVTTLSAPGKAIGAGSITVGSTTNYPTDTGITIAIRVVDTNGDLVAGTYTEWNAIVASGTSFTIDTTPAYGSDQIYAAGSTTQVFIPLSSYSHNKMIDALLTEHDQDGTHGNITGGTAVFSGNVTASGFTVSGAGSGGGWDGVFSGTVTAVTNNGNRNYDLTTSADNQALISPGMRLRTTRTVAAPTQCATFDGVNDYFSKTTPAGMTFTDDFTVGAWIKVSSYAMGGIISRGTGVNGWYLQLETMGQLSIAGFAGAAYRGFTTYQSVPLNKWVHVAATLDMSGNLATMYIDGVLVPSSVIGGSSISALTNTGDFKVGSFDTGRFFPGKIAQPFVSSTIISAANIRLLMSQGLTSALITAHNIISAYSFNNAITDLNTTNANNLTANGGVVATTADSPFGGQAGGTISSTLDYGIVAKVTASTITVNVAEGCTIPTSGGISAVSYSTYKSPYGFPGQEEKWTLESHIKTLSGQSSPVQNTWYNPGYNISAPVGEWSVTYTNLIYGSRGSGDNQVSITLSTANNSEVDKRFTTQVQANPSADVTGTATLSPNGLSVSSTTTYYMNIRTVSATMGAIYFLGDRAACFVRLKNPYL